MTFDEKEILSERIDNAVRELDADYLKAQNAADRCRETYWQMRERAQAYHNQRMILLDAQTRLWNGGEEF